MKRDSSDFVRPAGAQKASPNQNHPNAPAHSPDSENSFTWVIDTAATHHCTDNFSMLSEFTSDYLEIKGVGNSPRLISTLGGTYHSLTISEEGDITRITISDIHYFPHFGWNLLSIPYTVDIGVTLHIRPENDLQEASITLPTFGLWAPLRYERDSWVLDTESYPAKGHARATNPTLKAKATASRRIWHKRLAHLNDADLAAMASCGLIHPSPDNSRDLSYCKACHMGKMRHKNRNKHPGSRQPMWHA
ncbi:unnamed protein product [Phaeothamnion confervicola]